MHSVPAAMVQELMVEVKFFSPRRRLESFLTCSNNVWPSHGDGDRRSHS